MPDVLLAVLVLAPAILAYFLKSNAAQAFLALCGGFAVITLSGSDVQHLFGKTKITSLTSNDVDLILLVVPLLLTLFLTFKAVSTTSKTRLIQIIPALCAGGLLATVAAPMFNQALNINVSDSQLWQNMQNVQSYIVGLGLLSSLLLIWGNGFAHWRSRGKKHK
jgi:hypothetical protein